MAMSGTPRPAVDATLTEVCQKGESSNWLTPPPPAFQEISSYQVPSLLVRSVVPPAPITYGEAAGYSTIGMPAGTPLAPTATPQNEPLSPVEAKTVWPCAAASRKTSSSTSMEPSR